MPAPRAPRPCPCGSGEPFATCCRPLHRGRRSGDATAPTAERLMRSRYSAFAVGNPSYLRATWHPSTRPPTLDLDGDLEWTGLEIRRTSAGGEDDRDGTVEFVARYRDRLRGEAGEQHEHSAFVREDGQWFYVGPVRG